MRARTRAAHRGGRACARRVRPGYPCFRGCSRRCRHPGGRSRARSPVEAASRRAHVEWGRTRSRTCGPRGEVVDLLARRPRRPAPRPRLLVERPTGRPSRAKEDREGDRAVPEVRRGEDGGVRAHRREEPLLRRPPAGEAVEVRLMRGSADPLEQVGRVEQSSSGKGDDVGGEVRQARRSARARGRGRAEPDELDPDGPRAPGRPGRRRSGRRRAAGSAGASAARASRGAVGAVHAVDRREDEIEGRQPRLCHAQRLSSRVAPDDAGSAARLGRPGRSRRGERFVLGAVESVLGQTLRDLELIVVDDGSSDGTPQALASVRDPRLAVLRNERRRGLAASLNLGLERARGRFVARLDADDVALSRAARASGRAPSCRWRRHRGQRGAGRGRRRPARRTARDAPRSGLGALACALQLALLPPDRAVRPSARRPVSGSATTSATRRARTTRSG